MTGMQFSTIIFGLLGFYFLGQCTIGSIIRLFSRRLTLRFVFSNALGCSLFLFLSFAANIWEIQGQSWDDIVSQLFS